MNCFVLRVAGVWGVGQSLLLFGAWTSGRRPRAEGETPRGQRGPRRHRRRPACACIRRAALGCFIIPPGAPH